MEDVLINAELRSAYTQRMGQVWPSIDVSHAFFVSSPGRVNIIGEHTDYNNCPVFPIAVDKRVLAFVVPLDEPIIRVADINVAYGSIEFSFSSKVEKGSSIAAYETGNWGTYIKAAVNQLLEDSVEKDDASLCPSVSQWQHGFAMVMGSTIPQAAGMSSSSALVVLSAIALLEANGVFYDSEELRLVLSDLCRRAEHYVGTKGGGMDQTAIVMGKQGHATKISFNPIAVEHVPFAQECAIVVAHSTVEAPKTRAMMAAYNRRSIECSFAALFAAQVLQEEYQVEGIAYIGDLTPEKTGLNEMRLDLIATTLFHQRPYSLDEISTTLGISSSVLHKRYLRMRDGSPFPIPSEGFKLYHRFFHVWNEWHRVDESVDALKTANIQRLGMLMNASHFSCRDYHEISCPELDRLTEIARTKGALGSRLTGAGFGGCTVSLVKPAALDDFIEGILSSYYKEYLHLDEAEARKQIFIVQPSDGARVLK